MYAIEFTANAIGDLRFLKKRELQILVDAVVEQLGQEPLTETKNRKPLRPNDLAQWEVRVGDCRVFHDADEEGKKVVIKAVDWKEHNKLFLRGKEVKL